MSRALEELALRKQLLVTRAAVQRLRVAQQLGVLHEETRMHALARSVLRSRQARSLMLALAMMALGRTRAARAMRVASVVLGLAGVVRSWRRDATGPEKPPAGPA
jgi:hypothetical protein